jgi:hypothetical protein
MARLDRYQIWAFGLSSAQAISNLSFWAQLQQMKLRATLARLSSTKNCWLDHPFFWTLSKSYSSPFVKAEDQTTHDCSATDLMYLQYIWTSSSTGGFIRIFFALHHTLKKDKTYLLFVAQWLQRLCACLVAQFQFLACLELRKPISSHLPHFHVKHA